MSPPHRNLGFFRTCGMALICLLVFAVSYPMLAHMLP